MRVSAALLAAFLASSYNKNVAGAWTVDRRGITTRSLVVSNRRNKATDDARHLPTSPIIGTTRSSSTRQRSSRLFQSAEADIQLFNSKSRSKQKFTTLTPNIVNMYTCGPTVYDAAHIGNFRAFLTYDVLKRVLTYFGYNVTHVCNITDVDDKIINKCKELCISMSELTRRYESKFQDDLRALNIVPATTYPRATEHIPEMVDMILKLRDNGLAYQSEVDDSWYFDTSQSKTYGQQLVQLSEMDLQQQSTDRNELAAKKHFQDFCLWKAYKPDVDLEESMWDIPELGPGRPGWHLECSAMARKYLGDTLDVHCGGIDLKFPHHENEIAQSEGSSRQPFCNCWVHNGFVNIGDEKMSKSLGNFVTLREACPTASDVRAYRYLVVSSQYRTALSFTDQAMQAAKNAIKRMDKVKESVEEMLLDSADDDEVIDGEDSELATSIVSQQLDNFEAALRDDLSMPRAAAALFALVKAAETELKRVKKEDSEMSVDRAGLRAILNAMDQMDQVFGIFYEVPLTEQELGEQEKDAMVPVEIMELVGQRTAAKEAKDWELADSLRSRISELGFAVKDVKGGEPIVSRLE